LFCAPWRHSRSQSPRAGQRPRKPSEAEAEERAAIGIGTNSSLCEQLLAPLIVCCLLVPLTTFRSLSPLFFSHKHGIHAHSAFVIWHFASYQFGLLRLSYMFTDSAHWPGAAPTETRNRSRKYGACLLVGPKRGK
jgi:hypothetical protein